MVIVKCLVVFPLFTFHSSLLTYLIYPPVFFDIQALLNVFEANFN